MLSDSHKPSIIKMGLVYANATGEERLVVSAGRGKTTSAVVVWRTTNPKLPSGLKAQGSATVASFQRWGNAIRKATNEDWNAFSQVQQRREWNAEYAKLLRKYRLERRRKNARANV